MPIGLTAVAWIAVVLGVLCAAIVAIDIVIGHKQHMWIMNIVWPLTALYAGPLGLWSYFRIGRLSTHEAMMAAQRNHQTPPNKTKPRWQTIVVGTTHCGSGCTLGDVTAECFMMLVPITLFGHKIFGSWLVDYLAAFAFGVAFQYFTIKPMKQLSAADGIKAALKADAASLTAWQVGMYGWMAIATFLIFKHELPKSTPVFWFMMQIAMLIGFVTAYPVNAWLIKNGIKEAM